MGRRKEERNEGRRIYKEKDEAKIVQDVQDILHPYFYLSFLIMHRGSCCIRREIENSQYVFGKEVQHFYMRQQQETKDV
jgi:hypothetical protein